MHGYRTLIATLIATAGAVASADDAIEQAPLETPFIGTFEQGGADSDDWYYDFYEVGGAAEPKVASAQWWSGTPWYGREYYDGHYDAGGAQERSDDWFFDSYDDPNDSGLADI